MAAEIHERTAAGAVYIPEPRAVRTEMLFALFDEINLSNAPASAISLAFKYFGVKKKLLRVHEQDAVLLCTAIISSPSRWSWPAFFADDVLACRGDVLGHLRVEAVGRGDGDHLDVAIFEPFRGNR